MIYLSCFLQKLSLTDMEGTSCRFGKSARGQKNRFLTVLFLVLFCSIFFCLPRIAEAALLKKKPLRPAYYEQLEVYKREAAQYKAEQLSKKKEVIQKNIFKEHLVKPGETLSSIARAYSTDPTFLAYWNGLHDPDLIREGQVLRIQTLEGTAPDREGSQTVMAGLASRQDGRKEHQSGDGSRPAPLFQWPLAGEITSYYGWRKESFHYGLDIAAPLGESIGAAASGHVEFVGSQRGYGLMLTIEHGKGWSSLYAHNSAILVREGEYVLAGQPVARIGATGNATGPHLHLEIIFNGSKLDPLLFLP